MKVVVVEDEQAMGALIQEVLGGAEKVTVFERPADALEHLREHVVDVVLTDVRMVGMTGIELCEAIHALDPELPVIVMTGFGTMDTAIEAIRAGAYDFLAKPFELDALELAVQRAGHHRRLTREVRELRTQIERPAGMIGRSPNFLRVLEQVPKAGRSGVGVLIQGESGTGKELLARAVHDASPQSQQPFVAVNCSAIPENLVESELFGHVKGAFTDARTDRAGLFAEAGSGTLFLDEVGELPLAMQPKLLRVLQEHRMRPVGADREVPVTCRVIAATHVDLRRAVEEGRFRADLFYRLAVIRLGLPPLRERSIDVLEMAQTFLERAASRMGSPARGLSTAAARVVLAYGWPGNVRELQNAIEFAVAMADGPTLSPSDLPEDVRATRVVEEGQRLPTLAELEAVHIQRVLEATDGNKKAAAEILGLDRRTLYRKLDREG